MGKEGTLGSHRRRDSIVGTRKSHEEGIALRIHLVAVPLMKCYPEELTALCEDALILIKTPSPYSQYTQASC